MCQVFIFTEGREHLARSGAKPAFADPELPADQGDDCVDGFVAADLIVGQSAPLDAKAVCKFLLGQIIGFSDLFYAFIHDVSPPLGIS